MINPSPELPKDLTKVENVKNMMPVGATDNPPEAGTFQTLLQKQATEKTTKPFASPFEVARGAAPQLAAGPTVDSIRQQVVLASTTVGDINNYLQTRNLVLKPSSKYILASKLSQANQELNTVNKKVGGKPAEEEETELPAGTGIIQKLLSYAGGSQVALNNAQKQLQEMSEKNESLNPAELLYVQIKVNRAQQLLDYSAVMLAKAVDSMKSLFSTQI